MVETNLTFADVLGISEPLTGDKESGSGEAITASKPTHNRSLTTNTPPETPAIPFGHPDPSFNPLGHSDPPSSTTQPGEAEAHIATRAKPEATKPTGVEDIDLSHVPLHYHAHLRVMLEKYSTMWTGHSVKSISPSTPSISFPVRARSLRHRIEPAR